MLSSCITFNCPARWPCGCRVFFVMRLLPSFFPTNADPTFAFLEAEKLSSPWSQAPTLESSPREQSFQVLSTFDPLAPRIARTHATIPLVHPAVCHDAALLHSRRSPPVTKAACQAIIQVGRRPLLFAPCTPFHFGLAPTVSLAHARQIMAAGQTAQTSPSHAPNPGIQGQPQKQVPTVSSAQLSPPCTCWRHH